MDLPLEEKILAACKREGIYYYTAGDRLEGAPVLTCTIGDAPSYTLEPPDFGKSPSYTFRITYEKSPGVNENRSITLFMLPFIEELMGRNFFHASDGLELIKQTQVCGMTAWRMEDNPRPTPVNQQEFVALHPGESWLLNREYVEELSARPAKVGEIYTHLYTGFVVPWWTWGSLEDNKDFLMKYGSTSHDVRPKIIVPASNAVEYRIEPHPKKEL